jgi:hypothetical protein
MWFLGLVATLSVVGISNGEETELQLRADCNAPDESTKLWKKTYWTLSHFEVGGVNLALYKQEKEAEEQTKVSLEAEPFDLYEDFNIADQITGDEGWNDLIGYKQLLQRPSLSFYDDKVARKRWLPTMGYSQPRVFSLKYTHELTESGNSEDERMAIMDLLPTNSSYVAKPTHMSQSEGVWLVKHNTEDGITHFSRPLVKGKFVTGENSLDREHLARGVSEFLHRIKAGNPFEYSWLLANVKPGIVIEELFTDVTHEDLPPLEFCIFIIWGKAWIAQIMQQGRVDMGFVHPDGTNVFATQPGSFPDWLDYSELVKIAEDLGANKDLIRVDIFVGVPAGKLRAGASTEERMAAVQIAVSECALGPTTFLEHELGEEGARLWIAGYKIGNYRVVPNTEVPPSFLETGSFALSTCDA